MHANVNELVQEDGAVRGVRYAAPDGIHEIRAQVVVGADGRFSQMRRLAGIEPIRTAPPMDVLWFQLPRLPGEPQATTGAFGGIGRGRMLILLERTGYWQAGLVFPKGQYQEVRAQGVAAIRQSIAEIDPRFAKHCEVLTDWHQVTLLSVESSMCPVWHKPGLLLIGDAAHVMSPVGGVGINYAIQDAAAASNILTKPLKSGIVPESVLAEVQRERQFPVRVIQRMQKMMQERLIANALRLQKAPNIPWQLRLFTKIPIVRDLPVRLIVFGVRQVHLREDQ
jgi:2-polyprenyl-6-methoxyphenol hydroxylase-like FAD-dependent oxidoreductase